MQIKRIKNFLTEYNIAYSSVALHSRTTMHLGGTCPFCITIENQNQLARITQLINEDNLPWFALGKGSNLVFSSQGFEGLILSMGKPYQQIKQISENTVLTGAGISNGKAASFCITNGLSGLEQLGGFPGTIGGDLIGNAGPKGKTVSDSLLEIYGWNMIQNKECKLQQSELEFRYRYSNIEDIIITHALFEMKHSKREDLRKGLDEDIAKRKKNQPIHQWSAGCTFKNTGKYCAGKLIDDAGLKNLRIGGFHISDLHANFIIHDGSGTSDDLKELITMIRNTVFSKTGELLELEMNIIEITGQRWLP